MLLSSDKDGTTRLSSGGSTKMASIKSMFKQMLLGKKSNDDIILQSIQKCCSNNPGLPKKKHINIILKQMHNINIHNNDNDNDNSNATPDRITLLLSTLKWNNNNIITTKILTTLLILQHHCPSILICRFNEAIYFLQSLIDSDDPTINSLNRQYSLLLLQKIRFHNSNGTLLSRFFTTIPTTITSIVIDIDYSLSISFNESLLIISMLLTVQNEIIKLTNIILSIKDCSKNELVTYYSSLQPIIEESFCVMVVLSNLIKKVSNDEDKHKSITVSYINQYNDQLESLRLLYRRAKDIEMLKETESIPQTLPDFFSLV